MAWTDIPNADIDQDSPITQTLMTAYRDNIQWAWESTWHPYDMAYPGDGNDGKFYDFSVDGASASEETPDFVDGYDYRIVFRDISLVVTGAIRLELYRETTGSYSSTVDLVASATGTAFFTFDAYLNKPRLSAGSHTIDARGAALDVAMPVVEKITRARITTTANMDSGRIYLERRRDQIT